MYRTNEPKCMCYVQTFIYCISPKHHRLFLDHDVIFFFQTKLKKIQEIISFVLNTFENNMENEAFAPIEQILLFP